MFVSRNHGRGSIVLCISILVGQWFHLKYIWWRPEICSKRVKSQFSSNYWIKWSEPWDWGTSYCLLCNNIEILCNQIIHYFSSYSIQPKHLHQKWWNLCNIVLRSCIVVKKYKISMKPLIQSLLILKNSYKNLNECWIVYHQLKIFSHGTGLPVITWEQQW